MTLTKFPLPPGTLVLAETGSPASERDIVSYLAGLGEADRRDWLRTILRAYPDDAVATYREAKIAGLWEQTPSARWFRAGTGATIRLRGRQGDVRDSDKDAEGEWVWSVREGSTSWGGTSRTLAGAMQLVDPILRDKLDYVLSDLGE